MHGLTTAINKFKKQCATNNTARRAAPTLHKFDSVKAPQAEVNYTDASSESLSLSAQLTEFTVTFTSFFAFKVSSVRPLTHSRANPLRFHCSNTEESRRLSCPVRHCHTPPAKRALSLHKAPVRRFTNLRHGFGQEITRCHYPISHKRRQL